MVTRKIRIDRAHTLLLLEGKPVKIKIPDGVQAVELQMDAPAITAGLSGLAKCMDVFFNGRKA